MKPQNTFLLDCIHQKNFITTARVELYCNIPISYNTPIRLKNSSALQNFSGLFKVSPHNLQYIWQES